MEHEGDFARYFDARKQDWLDEQRARQAADERARVTAEYWAQYDGGTPYMNERQRVQPFDHESAAFMEQLRQRWPSQFLEIRQVIHDPEGNPWIFRRNAPRLGRVVHVPVHTYTVTYAATGDPWSFPSDEHHFYLLGPWRLLARFGDSIPPAADTAFHLGAEGRKSLMDRLFEDLKKAEV